MKKQDALIFEKQISDSKKKLLLYKVTGPWLKEPNRLEWEHLGMDCLIVRAPITYNLCGYVGVTKKHPFYEKDYDDVHDQGLLVHGGLTFSDHCQGAICHKKKQKVWWLGFDTSHCDDLSPGMMANSSFLKDMLPHLNSLGDPFQRGIYRDFDYVKKETENLAQQLAQLN